MQWSSDLVCFDPARACLTGSCDAHSFSIPGSRFPLSLLKGMLLKRNFNAFRFQECKTALAARKVMESKGVAHYWDMVARGDSIDAEGEM